MKFDKFTIQYLPEIFPNLDFVQEFSENFEVIASENLISVEKTGERWFATIDNDAITRNIQTVIHTRYTCQFLASENINFGILASANNVSAITDIGILTLFDIEVEKELIPLTRNYKITLSFTDKGIANIASFLDTENVEALTGGNSLTYTISEPAYTARVDIDASGGFQLPNTAEFSNIAQNDYIYLSSNEFNSDNLGLNVMYCPAKDANFLYFSPKSAVTITAMTNVHIQLGFNPTRAEDVLVVPRPLTVTLYTMLQPKISLIEPVFSDEIEIQSGIKKVTNAIAGNVLNCLFYVKEADLWKVKYINYANSAIYTKGSTLYYADYTAEIMVLNERLSLLGLYEAELFLPYNTLSADIN